MVASYSAECSLGLVRGSKKSLGKMQTRCEDGSISVLTEVEDAPGQG